MKSITIIAAIGNDRALGKSGQLLWRIPQDIQRFKELTTGHVVVMGRKTWESLPEKFRPLPNRSNIVISTNASFEAPGAQTASSLAEALQKAETLPGAEIFVIGGAQVYEEALAHATRLYLTLIHDTKDADVFFPPYERMFTKECSRKQHEQNGLVFDFVTLERI